MDVPARFISHSRPTESVTSGGCLLGSCHMSVLAKPQPSPPQSHYVNVVQLSCTLNSLVNVAAGCLAENPGSQTATNGPRCWEGK